MLSFSFWITSVSKIIYTHIEENHKQYVACHIFIKWTFLVYCTIFFNIIGTVIYLEILSSHELLFFDVMLSRWDYIKSFRKNKTFVNRNTFLANRLKSFFYGKLVLKFWNKRKNIKTSEFMYYNILFNFTYYYVDMYICIHTISVSIFF